MEPVVTIWSQSIPWSHDVLRKNARVLTTFDMVSRRCLCCWTNYTVFREEEKNNYDLFDTFLSIYAGHICPNAKANRESKQWGKYRTGLIFLPLVQASLWCLPHCFIWFTPQQTTEGRQWQGSIKPRAALSIHTFIPCSTSRIPSSRSRMLTEITSFFF